MGVELNAKTLLEKFKTGLGGSQKTGNGPDLWRDIRYPFT